MRTDRKHDFVCGFQTAHLSQKSLMSSYTEHQKQQQLVRLHRLSVSLWVCDCGALRFASPLRALKMGPKQFQLDGSCKVVKLNLTQVAEQLPFIHL